MNIYLICLFALIIFKIIIILNNFYNNNNDYNNLNDDYDDYSDDNNYKININNLRKMYIKSIVEEKYNNIYNKLVNDEHIGKSHSNFSVVCVPIKNKTEEECRIYDGYQKWYRQEVFRRQFQRRPPEWYYRYST